MLEHWLSTVQEDRPDQPEAIARRLRHRDDAILDGYELESLASIRATTRWNRAQLLSILRSMILRSTDDERDEVANWAREANKMPERILAIVEEFLRSSEPQVRRNAVTALATLGTADSLQLLVKTALSDESNKVRTRARLEILSLPDAKATEAAEVLREAIADPARVRDAYRLVGAMRTRGWTKNRPEEGLWIRLRRALYMRRHLARLQKIGLLAKMRAVAPSAFGGAAAVCGFFAAGMLMTPDSDLWAQGVLGGFAAVLIVTIATWRSAPVGQHFDREAASVIEIAISALVGGLLGAMIVIGSNGLKVRETLCAIFGSAIFVGAARMAAIVMRGTFRRAFLRQYGPAVTAAAFAIATLVVMIAATQTVDCSTIASTWFVLAASAFGIATGFIQLEGQVSVPSESSRLARVITGVAIVGVLIPVILVLLSTVAPWTTTIALQDTDNAITANADDSRSQRDIPILKTPKEVQLELTSPHNVEILVPQEVDWRQRSEFGQPSTPAEKQRDYVVSVKSDSGESVKLTAKNTSGTHRVTDTADDLPLLWGALPAGKYTVTARRSGVLKEIHSELDADYVLPALRDRLLNMLSFGQVSARHRSDVYDLRIIINPPDPPAEPSDDAKSGTNQSS
jgi:hypothetical protein